MELVFKILIWLFFWPVILLFRLVFWLTVEVQVPWEVLGILYTVLVMAFFGFLLWLDRRDSKSGFSRNMKLSWLIVTAVTVISDLALVLLCAWFSYDHQGISQICGAYALMLPILSGCVCFLVGLLKE